MSIRKVAMAIIAVVIVLPVLCLLVFVVTFNPNRYAPELVAAVGRATGRQLVLGGPIHFKLSLQPTIVATDLSLRNPPGFADPNLLTLSRLEARISLLPLLSRHLNIADLVLVQPGFTLERNRDNQADWDFSRPAASPSPGPGTASPASHHYKITLEAVQIQNGLVTIKGPGAAKATMIALSQMTGNADSGTSPLKLSASAAYDGTPFTIAGTVGSIARFTGTGAGPWPVDLTLNTNGATATLQGGIADPAAGHGYDVSVSAKIPALEVLAPALQVDLPGIAKLPPLHDLVASARIVDQDSAIPAIDTLSIKAGRSDLSAWQPGLSLIALDLEMASLDQPLTLYAAAANGGLALSVNGQFGAVQSLFDPALLPASMPPQGSFPVSVQAQAGTARLSLTGAIATPAALAGAALAVNATIPDVSALSPLAGTALPAWKNLQLQTTLIDPGGLGLAKAVGLDSLVVTMDNAAFGGAASLYLGPQPRLQAELHAQNVNLDGILAAIPASPAPPATPPTMLAATPPAMPPAVPAPATAKLIIPTQPLPLDLLKTASADIQLAADSLTFKKATYTALQAHAVLAGGVLTLNPVTGELPGGSVSASATLNAATDPAQASFILNAPALALPPFLKALNLPDTAQGTLQARMNLTGSGGSLHAMAATMNGQLGLALVNGIVDGGVLDDLFGAVLRTVGLPENLVGAQGPVPVRCFALRVDAANGAGTVRALTLDSSRLLVQGGGTIDFGAETLAVVLRPQLQFAGNPVGVPVEIGGSFANPVDTVATQDILAAAGNAAAGLATALANRIGGGNSLLGNVAAAVGLGGATDVCPAALSLGRLGQPGPAAAAPATAPSGGASPAAPGGPKSLLNALFGN